MKTPSKFFTWSFHLKINIFRFFKKCSFFEIGIFFENIFLHDEILFFVRIFFCDQVCISSNPRNHLEHLPFPHDDSGPPTRSNCWRKLGKFPRFSFCAPRNCPLFMSKSGAACLQMDLARSSRGFG